MNEDVDDVSQDRSFPTDVFGMLEIADALIFRLIQEQSREALFGAILATIHVVDWDPIWKEATKKFESDACTAFRLRHPEWDLLRQIGNGMKHATKRGRHVDELKHRNLEWEDDDWWENTGSNGKVWFVEMNGVDRAVSSIALGVLRRLNEELSARDITA